MPAYCKRKDLERFEEELMIIETCLNSEKKLGRFVKRAQLCQHYCSS